MNVFNHKRPLRRDNYDLAGALLEFLDRMKAQGQGEAAPCEPARFALLLTGPAALRKVPGIPGPWARTPCSSASGTAATLPQCGSTAASFTAQTMRRALRPSRRRNTTPRTTTPSSAASGRAAPALT